MNLRLLFLICSLLCLSLGQNVTFSSLWIAHSGCTFFYSTQPGFVFLYCISQSHNKTNWGTCLSECCTDMQGSDYSSPSLSSLYRCGDDSSSIASKIIAFIIIVLISALALTILLCFILIIYRLFKGHRHTNRVDQLRLQITSVEWEQQKFKQDVTSLTWSARARQDRPLPRTDSACSICLEQDTTALLFCGHQYHPSCIGGWLKKSSCCPCCRRDNIRGIKIYCCKCRWMYLVCTSTFLADNSKQIPKNCTRCVKQPEEELEYANDNFLVFEMDDSHENIQVIDYGKVNRFQVGSLAQLPVETIELEFQSNQGSA